MQMRVAIVACCVCSVVSCSGEGGPPEVCLADFAACSAGCKTEDFQIIGDDPTLSFGVEISVGKPPDPAKHTVADGFGLGVVGDSAVTLESIEYRFTVGNASSCYERSLSGKDVYYWLGGEFGFGLPPTLQPGQFVEVSYENVPAQEVEDACFGPVGVSSCEDSESFIATSTIRLRVGTRVVLATTRRAWGTCIEGEYPCEAQGDGEDAMVLE